MHLTSIPSSQQCPRPSSGWEELNGQSVEAKDLCKGLCPPVHGWDTHRERGREEEAGTTTLRVGVGVEPAVVVTPGGRGAVLVAMVGVWLELLEEAVVVLSRWG